MVIKSWGQIKAQGSMLKAQSLKIRIHRGEREDRREKIKTERELVTPMK